MKVLFLDGEREVPDYMGQMMRGIETFRMRYEDAIIEMNKKTERDYLKRAQSVLIAQHFRNFREG